MQKTTEKTFLFQPHPWEIIETEFCEENNLQSETIFSLGNGKIGVRGTFEEGFYGNPKKTAVGTYINGIYEYNDYHYAWKRPGFPDRTHSMINVANILPIELYIDDEKVCLSDGVVEDYKRVLDLKTGLLKRSFIWTGIKGKKIHIETERFVSLDAMNLAAISYQMKPINFSGTICILSKIDGAVENVIEKKPEIGSIDGVPTYLIKLHADDTASYVVQGTWKSQFIIGAAMKNEVLNTEIVSSKCCSDDRYVIQQYYVEAKKDETIVFNKYICLDAGKELDENELLTEVKLYAEQGYTQLKKKHEEKWADFWQVSDIIIDGDDALQQAVRYNAFQLMQGAGKDGKTNIGANALTGEGYQGHTFWDTEMYMFPFFLYTQPEVARQLLIYRHHILPEAKKRAKQLDGCGALFSWNSINGEECGFVFEAATAQYHINPDICFAILRYMDATGDDDFLVHYGAEILFETSKFMAHRGCFIKYKNDQFCINVVCGPDEYTPVVDNNCYTNYMTKVQLDFAYKTACKLKEEYPKEYKRITEITEVDEDEILLWKNASENMYIPYNSELDILMQDDQYLYREPIDIKEIEKDRLPLLTHLHPLNLWRYQVSKQADIVLLMYVMSHKFDRIMKEKIYNFYEPKTIHDSSLSVSIHSIVANDIGYYDQAYEYFMRAARMDLDDHNGNTAVGVHSACMGGTILALLNGFAGMKIHDGNIYFTPHIADAWNKYQFQVVYRNRFIQIQVNKQSVIYRLLKGDDIEIISYDEKIVLQTGVTIERNLI